MMKKLLAFLLLYTAVFFCGAGLYAQNHGLPLHVKTRDGATVAQFSEAHALVVGESNYNGSWKKLPGVKDDVAAVKQLFEELGFNVETIENAKSRELKEGIIEFFDKYGYIKDARLIFYFAGHGYTLTLGTKNKMGYIVPVDAPFPGLFETSFKQNAIPMDQFYSWARTYDAPHILFIFDCCYSGIVFRSSPDESLPAIDHLIAQPVRQFITSGSGNEEVPDESIFRRELEAALRFGLADSKKTGYVTGTELGNYLSGKVSTYMRGRQNPQSGKINDVNLDKGEFIFSVGTEVFLSPDPSEESGMALINTGTFLMGSYAREMYRRNDETQHHVTVSGFYMGRYEVTQKEWFAVMGTTVRQQRDKENPNWILTGESDNDPMYYVSWTEAVEYCNKRSLIEGLMPVYTINGDDVRWNMKANGYRLPTEAEWEYACRAGTTTAYNTGADISNNTGWYLDNSDDKTHPVGQKPANAWGLYDMHGNVWEWCWDWYGSYPEGSQVNPRGAATGAHRVSRGGSYVDSRFLRSAHRNTGAPSGRIANRGFRIARNAE